VEKEEPKFLAVLPWLQLEEEIEVGPFTFWRWPEDAESHIPTNQIDEVRKTLSANFRQLYYERKKWELEPMDSLCIANHGEKEFLHREDDLNKFRMAVDILCLSALFRTDVDKTFRYVRFYLNYTDFNWIGIPLGSEVISRSFRRRHGELLVGEMPPVPVVKPRECTNTPMNGHDTLISSLGQLLELPSDDFNNRVFRALFQFNSAFSDYPHGSILSDLVTITTAFEILFNIRKKNKAEELGKKITELFPGSQTVPKQSSNEPGKVYWVKKFYRLRNDIVHGKRIAGSDLEWVANPNAGRYPEIAIYIFRLAISKLLAAKGIHKETDLDIYQSDILDRFLSKDDFKRFPRENDLDYISWLAKRTYKFRN
jgi:hypothetical protein